MRLAAFLEGKALSLVAKQRKLRGAVDMERRALAEVRPMRLLEWTQWRRARPEDLMDGGVLRKPLWEPQGTILSQAMQRNMLSDPVAKVKQ